VFCYIHAIFIFIPLKASIISNYRPAHTYQSLILTPLTLSYVRKPVKHKTH
jgi:hypothetical protein